jgi:hypothetical protein
VAYPDIEYAVSCVNPVISTVVLTEVLINVVVPVVAMAVYRVIADPPKYVGAVKMAVICVELFGVTDDKVGALGTYV